MIELGIQKLVQADSAVLALCPVGGFFVQIPKGSVLPSWSYQTVSNQSVSHLKGVDGLTFLRLQIDCFGDQAQDVIRLAVAIDKVLNGFSGLLTDPDTTRVQSCFSSNAIDFFDDAPRTYRRMLDYEIWFNAS